MTRVSMSVSSGLYGGYTVKGHSGYAPDGSDIVCAAVSALTMTCVNAIEKVCGREPVVEIDEYAAELRVSIPMGMDDGRRWDAHVLMSFMVTGLEDLSSQYPDHVSINGQQSHKEGRQYP